MDAQDKLRRDIEKFLEVYKILSSDGKAQFEAQMAGEVKNKDEKTKKLYRALLQAARNGRGIEEAIEEMSKASA